MQKTRILYAVIPLALVMTTSPIWGQEGNSHPTVWMGPPSYDSARCFRELFEHPDAWKDTVFVPVNRELELAVRFPDYADPATPYMYHCHVLYHEDQGMMAQFVVVEPGQQASPMPMGRSHGH